MYRLPFCAWRVAVMLVLLLMAVMPLCAQQKGKASYYSRRANGARTSSGVRLDNDSLVCAHRTHPFGTLLKVKNPANGKEVIVKVIDRGPYKRGRVIDLSYEAARRLGILTAGVALVEVSVFDGLLVPFKLDPAMRPELELELEMPATIEELILEPEWQWDRVKKKRKHNSSEVVKNEKDNKGTLERKLHSKKIK